MHIKSNFLQMIELNSFLYMVRHDKALLEPEERKQNAIDK